MIAHDSTEEKLFAKASDAVLARAFRELGLKASVITERADTADVVIESVYHGYTMVADAKAFRLSRTAKNQKDFKVVALSGWRKNADYAVLCAPYFHYPANQSQIYSQSIEYNVCLLSWEHLIFLLSQGIRETIDINLVDLWSFGESYKQVVTVADQKKCYLQKYNKYIAERLDVPENEIMDVLEKQVKKLSARAVREMMYWELVRSDISSYTQEQAVRELISSLKINEKITQIEKWRLFDD